jgi:hypothetical protein
MLSLIHEQSSCEICLHEVVIFHPSYGSTAQRGPWPPPLRFLNHTELDAR